MSAEIFLSRIHLKTTKVTYVVRFPPFVRTQGMTWCIPLRIRDFREGDWAVLSRYTGGAVQVKAKPDKLLHAVSAPYPTHPFL